MSRRKRMVINAVLALALCILLASTAFALGYFLYEVKDNYFHTGTLEVSIAYEDPKPGEVYLFQGGMLLEPGMTVRRDFTVTNLSTDHHGIWYRLYFTEPKGELADVLEARICDGEACLWTGILADWTAPGFMEDPQTLPYGGAKTLTLELHYPEAAGNATQAKSVAFALSVSAVQRSNNPSGLFD